jgi:hypothetical protein
MFGVSAAVIVLVTVLIFVGALHRRRGRSDPGETPRWPNGMILVGWPAVPDREAESVLHVLLQAFAGRHPAGEREVGQVTPVPVGVGLLPEGGPPSRDGPAGMVQVSEAAPHEAAGRPGGRSVPPGGAPG